jgi:hypothetical protein
VSTDAIVTMLIGMVAIWGGLAASITVIVRRTRRGGGSPDAEPGPRA